MPRPAQGQVLQRAQLAFIGERHGAGSAAGDEGFQLPDRRRELHRFQLGHRFHLGDLPVAEEDARFSVLIG